MSLWTLVLGLFVLMAIPVLLGAAVGEVELGILFLAAAGWIFIWARSRRRLEAN